MSVGLQQGKTVIVVKVTRGYYLLRRVFYCCAYQGWSRVLYDARFVSADGGDCSSASGEEININIYIYIYLYMYM